MISKKVAVTGTPQSISQLLDIQRILVSSIALQAPQANTQIVFFGNKAEQPVELRPKANASLCVVNTTDVYIKGTVGDFVTIVLFSN